MPQLNENMSIEIWHARYYTVAISIDAGDDLI
jgi:hypothetical protein